MALSTAFTRLFGVRHPIALAPTADLAGVLAAQAVHALARAGRP